MQECADRALVFLRRKRAGRINEPSAAPQHLRRAVQDLLLTPGAHFDRFLAPIGDGRLFLAEHPLARAGRVHKDLVKPFREALRQLLRMLVQHQCIRNSEPLHISGEDPRPLWVDLIADQQPLAAQCSGQLGRLASRRGTQVEHPFAGLHIQKSRRCHRARLLQIVKPRVVIGAEAGAALRVIVKAVLRPRHRRQAELRERRRQTGLEGIETQTDVSWAVVGREESLIFRAKQALHPRKEQFRQHSAPSPSLHILIYYTARRENRQG